MYRTMKWVLLLGLLIEVNVDAAPIDFPQKFDGLGPTVKQVKARRGVSSILLMMATQMDERLFLPAVLAHRYER